LLTLAEEALAAMPGDQEDVRILLNPEECTRIKELAPERAAAWRLIPDEKLALGECRVITAQAEADIGCQQRLDSCMDTLGEHIRAEA
jgi:flagellar assembly protein FliH